MVLATFFPIFKNNEQLAREILSYVMQFRRMTGVNKCALSRCEACIAPHLHQIILAIDTQQPITFVLPAFPAKSPNPTKVLGILPDMAELLSLKFLNSLCQQIQEWYSPGARIILCSDGRVFNDIVGISDVNVTYYQRELSKFIYKNSLSYLSIFDLDETFSKRDFNHMRNHLVEKYSESLDMVKDEVRRNEEARRLYCGITRFLVEDAIHPSQTLSRSAIQKICSQRAYIVIQRSRAWGSLIARRFPAAVRLSIHPQACGASKLGIRLLEAHSWMTPWHGVAVDIGESVVLLKRAQARELGARLIYRHNRPSHYVLLDKQKILKLKRILHGI